MTQPAISIGIVLVTFFLVVLLDRVGKVRRLRIMSLIGLFAALFALPFSIGDVVIPLFSFDLLGVFFSIIFLGVALCVVLASKEQTVAYYGSVLLSTAGMMLAASANDLLILYLSIELVTVPTYVLVGYKKTLQRMESAVKYFIVSIVASALLLLGVILLALSVGSTSIADFVFVPGGMFIVGMAAFIAGLGFKLSIFPFNLWIPDVYQGAPPEIAGLLAGASKKAAYAALLRVALVFGLALQSWTTILLVLAALTMTIPNIIALLQTNVRRLLAYSIMTHAGFLMMGVAIGTQVGFSATLFHAFTHAFMALGAFLVLGVFAAVKLEKISDLRGFGFRNPFLGASLSLFLLSLAGLPILAGFASKFYLFYTAIAEGYAWLAMLAIANSGIALYYYFRIIRSLYGDKSSGRALKVNYGTLVAVIICLFLLLFFGIYPQPVIELAMAASGALF